MRDVAGDDLMLVIAAGQPEDMASNSFLLDNMSKRMADTLREDAAALPPPDTDAYERAVSRIAGTVRGMADAGTITLKPAPD